MDPQTICLMKQTNSEVDLNSIVGNLCQASDVYHMHAARAGPFNANEIYLAVKEKERNNELRIIRGLLQPNAQVSKFLNYWFAGLDEKIYSCMIQNAQFHEGRLYKKDNELDPRMMNHLASEVHIEWKHFVEIFFKPLYKGHYKLFHDHGFADKNYEELIETRKEVVSLEDAMVEASNSVLNTVLIYHDLPKFIMEKFNPLEIPGIILKYVSRVKLNEESGRLLEKRRRLTENAYRNVLKELKSFNGKFPNPEQLEKVLIRCYRKDPSFECLQISEKEIQKRFENPSEEIGSILHYNDSILLTILAHKKSIQRLQDSDSVPYIDGENMVLSMFEIANKKRKGLILQEFIRGNDYQIYRRLLPKYSNLEVGVSACRTWDVKEFPEFDFNLVRGLNYLH